LIAGHCVTPKLIWRAHGGNSHWASTCIPFSWRKGCAYKSARRRTTKVRYQAGQARTLSPPQRKNVLKCSWLSPPCG
jgi:hypothetical protein